MAISTRCCSLTVLAYYSTLLWASLAGCVLTETAGVALGEKAQLANNLRPNNAQVQVGSRLKRPSNVGELIHRNREYEASAQSPIYIEQNSKTRRHVLDFDDRHSSPAGESDISPNRFGLFSEEKVTPDAFATPNSIATPACFNLPISSTPEKDREVDLTMKTPRLDPKMELSQSVRFDGQEETDQYAGKLYTPLPFQSPAHTYSVFKAAVRSREVDFDAITPRLGEKTATAFDYSIDQREEEAYTLLHHAREELAMLNERWKASESSSRRKGTQVNSLLHDLASLETEVHTISRQKDSLNAGLGKSKWENARLSSELLQVLARYREASQNCASLSAQKEELEARIVELSRAQSLEQKSLQLQANSEVEMRERVQELEALLEVYKEEKECMWRRTGELQQAASDSEQLQMSQRQQLHALCRTLEASEAERLALVSRLNSSTKDKNLLQKKCEFELHALRQQYEGRVNQLRTELAKSCDVVKKKERELQTEHGELERVNQAYQVAEEAWKRVQHTLQLELKGVQDAARQAEDCKEKERLSLQMEIEEKQETITSLSSRMEEAAHENSVALSEVEKQMQSELEREKEISQAKEAEASEARRSVDVLRQELASSREDAEVQVSLSEQNLQDAYKRLAEAQEQVSILQQHAGGVEILLNQARETCTGLESELVLANERHFETSLRLTTQEGEVQRLVEQGSQRLQAKKMLEQELAECRNQIDTLLVEKEHAEQTLVQLAELKQEIESLQEGNRELRCTEESSSRRLAELEEEAARISNQRNALQTKCDDMQHKLETSERRETDLEAALKEVEEDLRLHKSSKEESETRWEEMLQAEGESRKDVEARVSAFAEDKELLQTELASCQAQLGSLREESQRAMQQVNDLESRCKETERIAREATRSSSKELGLVQVQASHLRQQVESLTRERDSAQVAVRGKEEEMSSLRKKFSEQIAEAHAQCEELREEVRRAKVQAVSEVGTTGEDSSARSPGRDGAMMQSVIAQRTRGRINDSARQAHQMKLKENAAPAETHEHGGAAVAPGEEAGRASDASADGTILQSVVAKRTRGRTVDKEYAFFLRHIPASGAPPPVKIPEEVQLSHTGFVIGRFGADLVLTSGYVSRKHAQLQRTATGWRVLDTSTNGLCVNGVKVKSQQLSDGDVLLFEVPQTVGFSQEVPPNWDEKSHFRFRFCVEPVGPSRQT